MQVIQIKEQIENEQHWILFVGFIVGALIFCIGDLVGRLLQKHGVKMDELINFF